MKLLLFIAILSSTMLVIAYSSDHEANSPPSQPDIGFAVQDPDTESSLNAQIGSAAEVPPASNDPLAMPDMPLGGEKDDALKLQDPSACIDGIAEVPCAIMDVRRRCGSLLPIEIDLGKNYTFHTMQFSIIGGNWSMSLSFPPKGNQTDPAPMSGKAVAGFSDILYLASCKRPWWKSLVKCARDIVMTVVFALVVVKVLEFLPIRGIFR